MQVKCINFNSLLHPGLGSKFCSANWHRATWSILDLFVGSGPNQIICGLLGMSGHDPALPGLNRSVSNSSLLGWYLEFWNKVPDTKVIHSLKCGPVLLQSGSGSVSVELKTRTSARLGMWAWPGSQVSGSGR